VDREEDEELKKLYTDELEKFNNMHLKMKD
jgi:hypothetical protein